MQWLSSDEKYSCPCCRAQFINEESIRKWVIQQRSRVQNESKDNDRLKKKRYFWNRRFADSDSQSNHRNDENQLSNDTTFSFGFPFTFQEDHIIQDLEN